jgi:hypothetical protein
MNSKLLYYCLHSRQCYTLAAKLLLIYDESALFKKNFVGPSGHDRIQIQYRMLLKLICMNLKVQYCIHAFFLTPKDF